MTNEEAIKLAEEGLKPKMVNGRLLGNVSAMLTTEAGDTFSGVCIDTGSGTGFCAEASAIGAMVTAGQYKIKSIVAVWKDDNSELYVMPPCGRCRLFISQIDEGNIDTNVILGKNKTLKLSELLPYTEWPEPLNKNNLKLTFSLVNITKLF